MVDMPQEHTRLKWKGMQPFDDDGNPTPGFPGEHFASIPIKDFTDSEYDNELDDEQREQIKSRPDLYDDRGSAEDAKKRREAKADDDTDEKPPARTAHVAAHNSSVVTHDAGDKDKTDK